MPGDQEIYAPQEKSPAMHAFEQEPRMLAVDRKTLVERLRAQASYSDRGMSLAQWQDWIVDLLIKKHDEGLSDNQLRMIFANEFDRRYGGKESREIL